jgi:hypothetical protein
MLYQPTGTLTVSQAPNWTLRTVVGVAQSEGLKLISNTVANGTRTVVYDVIGGAGGTIVELLPIVRQAGENEVTVEVVKDKKKKGESIVSYD